MIRAWRCDRPVRGPRGAALVALPHRDERLPRHAEGPRAARAADGSRSRAVVELAARADAARGRLARSRSPTRASSRRGRRSRRARALARDDPARVRRGAAASAAAAARGADPAARSCAGRRPRSPSCSRRRPRRSTARCSARARRSTRAISRAGAQEPLDEANRELLARYVDAFERYDMESLTSLLHEDATQSMPPYELWLSGRDDILGWWFGTGIGCKGSRLVPTTSANGSPAFGQYKPGGPNGTLHAVGAAGARALRRRDRRVHVLPRHRDALPALRSA